MCIAKDFRHSKCNCFLKAVVVKKCPHVEETPYGIEGCDSIKLLRGIPFTERPYCRKHYYAMLIEHHEDCIRELSESKGMAQQGLWSKQQRYDFSVQSKQTADLAIAHFKEMYGNCDADFETEWVQYEPDSAL